MVYFVLQIESFYPEDMGPNIMPVNDFLANGIPLLDKHIEDKIKKASSNGNALRYVCVIEGSRYFCTNVVKLLQMSNN